MNGYNQYKEKSIYSMSGAEQLLLLFDEAIKRLIRAENSLKENNYDDFEDCLLAGDARPGIASAGKQDCSVSDRYFGSGAADQLGFEKDL